MFKINLYLINVVFIINQSNVRIMSYYNKNTYWDK